ncbi:MAG: AAA family ATPase [Deltaproteobacteria bacterium]|jgi:predicted ATP-binding protein involved in virulence|nr:AAA family ATPase [Deltaproteobacteria bacterium]
MKLKSMLLENYRCFQSVEIDFDERLTIFVGNNASGKSAVMDALSTYLETINMIVNFDLNFKFNLQLFSESDISYYYGKEFMNYELIIDNYL